MVLPFELVGPDETAGSIVLVAPNDTFGSF